jgi:hypothetical protein
MPGFTGDICLTDVDECASSPCVQGICSENESGNFLCTCNEGFTGVNCETVLETTTTATPITVAPALVTRSTDAIKIPADQLPLLENPVVADFFLDLWRGAFTEMSEDMSIKALNDITFRANSTDSTFFVDITFTNNTESNWAIIDSDFDEWADLVEDFAATQIAGRSDNFGSANDGGSTSLVAGIAAGAVGGINHSTLPAYTHTHTLDPSPLLSSFYDSFFFHTTARLKAICFSPPELT